VRPSTLAWLGVVHVFWAAGVAHATQPEVTPDEALRRGANLFHAGESAAAIDVLAPLAEGKASGRLAVRAAFVLARARAARADGAGAVALLERARALTVPLGPAFRWAEVEVKEAAGAERAALAMLQALRHDEPQFRGARAALWESVLRERVSPPSDAAAFALELLPKAGLKLPRDELLWRAARLLERSDRARADKLWRRLLLEEPDSVHDIDAQRRVALDTLSKTVRLARAVKLFKRRTYEACRAELLPLWKAGFHKEEVGYYLGTIASERLRDDYEGAVQYFRATVGSTHGVGQPHGESAQAKLGVVLAKVKRYDAAVSALRAHLERFPASEKRIEVSYDLGRILYESGRAIEGARALEAGIAGAKHLDDRGKYDWFVAWWLFRGGKLDEALSRMARLAGSGNALVGGKASYWSARVLDQKGERGRAVDTLERVLRRWPHTYYALLAERTLERWTDKPTKVPRPNLSLVGSRPEEVNPFVDLPDTPAIARLHDAVAVGEADRVRVLASDARADVVRAKGGSRAAKLDQDLLPWTGRYPETRAAQLGAASLALARYPTAASVDAWRAVYPRAFPIDTTISAERAQIPEWLVYAHMLQESRYKPWLISGAPAYGLLELLPRTARRLAAEAHEAYALPMLMDPGPNIRWGARYLGLLLKKYKGQFPFAIAGYNGGPGLVDHHLRTHAGVPFDVLIEDMPQHESRNYVRMVIGHLLRYLAAYETPERAAALRSRIGKDPWDGDSLKDPDY